MIDELQPEVPTIGEQLEATPAVPEAVSVEVAKSLPPKIPKLIFKSRYGMPTLGFIAHKHSYRKFHEIVLPEPRLVQLAKDLPRKWEKVCYVGHNTKGRNNPSYLPAPGFRKGDYVTVTAMLFYPNQGTYYSFSEGARGGYMLRPDQITNPEVEEKHE